MNVMKPSTKFGLSKAIAAVLLAACFASTAWAAPAECSKPDKAQSDMSESAYNGLETAMDFMSKKKYNEAIEKLAKLAETGSDYEKAMMNYNLGFAHSSKNDYASAVKAFSKALSFNTLPRSQAEP